MNKIDLNIHKVEITHILNRISLFKSISERKISSLIKYIDFISIEREECVIHEGEEAKYFYWVYSGKFVVLKQQENKQHIVGKVKSGEIIGEMSFITDLPRSASVKALRESILLRLPNVVLKDFAMQNPEIFIHVSSVIAKRLKENIENTENINKNGSKILFDNKNIFSLIGAGSSRINEAFIKNILKLNKSQNLYILNEEEFFLLMTQTYPKLHHKLFYSNLWRMQLLAKLEHIHNNIILDCGYNVTDWSKFCLQSSDNFLLLANENASLEFNELENYIQTNNQLKNVPKRIIFNHLMQTPLPKRVTAWLEQRDVDINYNICLEKSETLGRFIRLLEGNCLGLVLSGGGSLGLAHIGVLRALEEENIPIDMVGGVSSGAIIAALFASGLNSYEMTAHIKKWIHQIKLLRFFAWQIPLTSFISPNFADKFFLNLLGDIDINELWINFFCISCNLTTTDDKIFDKGSLKKAVLASNSLPGMLSPSVCQGELFVDGGVTNTLPVDIMKQRYGGFAIAVNVSQKRQLQVDKNSSQYPSTIKLIWNKLNPFKKFTSYPLIHEIVGRAFIICNKRKLVEAKKMADYYIEPDFSKLKRANYKSIDEIIQIGYEAAKKEIKHWDKIVCQPKNKNIDL